ncbi:unnamed protein product [Blepharisma stoltei]|uniref:Uncharacterized protein n=1 Tax=Blepharisma stoltei TaxID=1481888 RepID=A0AAU9ITK6_9CILI|nr:unnamed protein product [Blepharisma stoltei]
MANSEESKIQSLTKILHIIWMGGPIPKKRLNNINKTGQGALTLYIMNGSIPICSKLIPSKTGICDQDWLRISTKKSFDIENLIEEALRKLNSKSGMSKF